MPWDSQKSTHRMQNNNMAIVTSSKNKHTHTHTHTHSHANKEVARTAVLNGRKTNVPWLLTILFQDNRTTQRILMMPIRGDGFHYAGKIVQTRTVDTATRILNYWSSGVSFKCSVCSSQKRYLFSSSKHASTIYTLCHEVIHGNVWSLSQKQNVLSHVTWCIWEV